MLHALKLDIQGKLNVINELSHSVLEMPVFHKKGMEKKKKKLELFQSRHSTKVRVPSVVEFQGVCIN